MIYGTAIWDQPRLDLTINAFIQVYPASIFTTAPESVVIAALDSLSLTH